MKLPITLKDRELSKNTLESIEDIIEDLVDKLIDSFESQLLKDDRCLSEQATKALKKYLKDEATVTLTISVDVDEKKMSGWEIYPVEAGQSNFDDFPEVPAELVNPPEREADFEEVIEGPAAPERLMLEAGEEETVEEQEERLKKDVDEFVEENPQFRAVQEYCEPEIIEDLKKAEDEKHRKERRKRAKEA